MKGRTKEFENTDLVQSSKHPKSDLETEDLLPVSHCEHLQGVRQSHVGSEIASVPSQ
jgi:hypothetical protein